MKSLFFAVLLVCLSLSLAKPDHHYGKGHGGHGGHGHGHGHGPAYYSYGYKVHGDYHKTNFGHSEKRSGKTTHGEYFVHLPDGRIQTVTYSVDGYKGYVAHVKYSGKAHFPAHHGGGGYKSHKPAHGGYH